MKRWIHASSDTNSVSIGDEVTVYSGTHGYANYDGTLIDTEVNKYGVEVGVVDTGKRIEKVPMSSIIPSEKRYFYSLKLDDVLTSEFVAKMIHRDDSMWCDRIKYPRVDRDLGMENVVGTEAHIQATKPGEQDYRVVVVSYIDKHGSTDRDIIDEWHIGLNDPLVDEALDVMSKANEVVVNFAGYQRIFKQ